MASPALAPVTSVVPEGSTGQTAREEAGTAADRVAAPSDSPSAFSKVARFLRSIRGLGGLPADEFKALLYEWRFDLVAPPKAGWADPAVRKGAGGKLPLHSEIPLQRELHDLLLGGSLPGGHQCIAHILYPDFVPWPFSLAGVQTGRESAKSRTDALNESLPSDAHSCPCDRAASTEPGTSSTQRQATGNANGKISSGTQARSAGSADAGPSEGAAEVVVRGQRVKSSVLGARARERREEAVPLEEVVPVDDCSLKAARERRQYAERAAKVERYNEKKLLERIQSLEVMRQAEVEQQEAVQRREAQRLARHEALRKDLQAGYSRKMEEERAKQEQDAEKQKEEAAAEQRAKRYREKQKEQLNQWYAEGGDACFARDTQAKQRHAELQARKKAQGLERQGQKKTVKELETLQRVQRIQAAAEERPPLPPKQHDLPRPVLELVGGTSDRPSSARSGSQSARAAPGSWATQARAVSNMYGLSDKEQSHVQAQVSRGVRGAGRMAGSEH